MQKRQVTRDDFNDFKNNPTYGKLIDLLDLGYESAIAHYLESGNDVRLGALVYKEIKAVLESGDVLIDGETDET